VGAAVDVGLADVVESAVVISGVVVEVGPVVVGLVVVVAEVVVKGGRVVFVFDVVVVDVVVVVVVGRGTVVVTGKAQDTYWYDSKTEVLLLSLLEVMQVAWKRINDV